MRYIPVPVDTVIPSETAVGSPMMIVFISCDLCTMTVQIVEPASRNIVPSMAKQAEMRKATVCLMTPLRRPSVTDELGERDYERT